MPSRSCLLVALPVAVLLLAIGAQASVTDEARSAGDSTAALVAKSVGTPTQATRKGAPPGPVAPPIVALGLMAVGAVAIPVAQGRARRVVDAPLAWRSLLVGAPPVPA